MRTGKWFCCCDAFDHVDCRKNVEEVSAKEALKYCDSMNHSGEREKDKNTEMWTGLASWLSQEKCCIVWFCVTSLLHL